MLLPTRSSSSNDTGRTNSGGNRSSSQRSCCSSSPNLRQSSCWVSSHGAFWRKGQRPQRSSPPLLQKPLDFRRLGGMIQTKGTQLNRDLDRHGQSASHPADWQRQFGLNICGGTPGGVDRMRHFPLYSVSRHWTQERPSPR